jgi:hypothetical protein
MSSHRASQSHAVPITAGSVSGLTKDHRLLIKVIEAKGLSADHTDTHCVVRIDNNVNTQVTSPSFTPACLLVIYVDFDK